MGRHSGDRGEGAGGFIGEQIRFGNAGGELHYLFALRDYQLGDLAAQVEDSGVRGFIIRVCYMVYVHWDFGNFQIFTLW